MQLSQFPEWLWVGSYGVAVGAVRQLQLDEYSAWSSGGRCLGATVLRLLSSAKPTRRTDSLFYE